ncbi:MAG: hypothetical protein K0S53_1409 [Bacteroidetes bacterium]|jgi:hypothetical protein|nr:hypothetical protein [Bacteroidota bacterium]MDF2452597.1 hypothetical protein [Bacteroidota bacterium]
MLLKIKTFVLISSAFILLNGCGGSKQEEVDASEEDSTIVGLDSQKISAQNVFNTIPSRATILDLTKLASTEYNVQYLNNPDDVSKYSLESSRALNLGVYGADLNVASIYEQTQESMLFFKCVSIIAKSIGVSNSFDENMGDRMIANQSNRDSTLNIITQAFKSADNTLRKNGRPGTSSLLVAGAWIEGLYVACQTAKETKNEPIIKEIFNQKESLNNLIELLESSKVSSEADYIINDLYDIKKILESKTDDVFTINALTELDKKITALRNQIISNK